MPDKSNYISNRMMQKNLLRRRLWAGVSSLLLFFLYYVGYMAMVLTQMRSEKGMQKTAMQFEIQYLFGSDSFGMICIITAVLAVLLGISGFAWMDSKKQLIFYESLPVSRTRRFVNIVVNSLLIYLVSFFVMMTAGILLTCGFGLGSGELVRTALLSFVRNTFLFFAIYASSVLAAMLTGNVLIAILAECVFLFFEPVLDLILNGYASTMFETYVMPGSVWTHIFSPLASMTGPVSFRNSVLINLAGGAVCLILAFLIYIKFRKNETAGAAVLFKPVRAAAKIAVTIIAALAVGLVTCTSGIAFAIAAMLIAALIVGGIMEVIYNYNIRAMLRHPFTALIAAGISILIFCGYHFDVTGYDTWVPDVSDVGSAYLFDTGYYTNHYLENGDPVGTTEEYYEKYMYLTDIDSVNEVLKAGEEALQQENTSGADADDSGSTKAYVDLYIAYRMKNGTTQKRYVDLPVTDETVRLMDDVVGTDKFREGFFQIYHDGYVENNLDYTKISYWNGSDLTTPYSVTARETYVAFKKAYLKDIQGFTFGLANGDYLIGDLMISRNSSEEQNASDPYFSLDYPVYGTFTNTIAFLKENGIYQEPANEEVLEKQGRTVSLQGPFGGYGGIQ